MNIGKSSYSKDFLLKLIVIFISELTMLIPGIVEQTHISALESETEGSQA